jgi:hypothetical protein
MTFHYCALIRVALGEDRGRHRGGRTPARLRSSRPFRECPGWLDAVYRGSSGRNPRILASAGVLSDRPQPPGDAFEIAVRRVWPAFC